MSMMKRLIEDMAAEINGSLSTGDTDNLRKFLDDLGGNDTDKLYLLIEGIALSSLIAPKCDECGKGY